MEPVIIFIYCQRYTFSLIHLHFILMATNNVDAQTFLGRYRVFLIALFLGALSCYFIFFFFSTNDAYFSIISYHSTYSMIIISPSPKATPPDTDISTRVSNFLKWIEGLKHKIETQAEQLELLTSDYNALKEKCSDHQD